MNLLASYLAKSRSELKVCRMKRKGIDTFVSLNQSLTKQRKSIEEIGECSTCTSHENEVSLQRSMIHICNQRNNRIISMPTTRTLAAVSPADPPPITTRSY